MRRNIPVNIVFNTGIDKKPVFKCVYMMQGAHKFQRLNILGKRPLSSCYNFTCTQFLGKITYLHMSLPKIPTLVEPKRKKFSLMPSNCVETFRC